jgi:hypothetical protein
VTYVVERCISSNECHHDFSSLYSVPSGSPWNVTITKRSKNELTVSWRAPDQSLQTDQLTGYKVCYFDKARSSNSNCSVCYSDKARSRNPSCFQENDQSYTIVMGELRPATPYFVTVTAGTSGGYGPKSKEISKITNGGKTIIRLNLLKQICYSNLHEDNLKLCLLNNQVSMNTIRVPTLAISSLV